MEFADPQVTTALKALENALAREKQLMTSLEIAHKTIRGYERENARYRVALLYYAQGAPVTGYDRGEKARKALGE